MTPPAFILYPAESLALWEVRVEREEAGKLRQERREEKSEEGEESWKEQKVLRGEEKPKNK